MVLDSGDRTEFSTGAVTDMHEGKGRCDLIPFLVISELLTRYHDEQDLYDEAFWSSCSEYEIVSNILDKIEVYRFCSNVESLYHAIIIFSIHEWGSIPKAIMELSIHYAEGAQKYGDRNWEKGIPEHCHIDSAVRHLMKYLDGWDDESHSRAVVWRLVACIYTHIYISPSKPELDDFRKKE